VHLVGFIIRTSILSLIVFYQSISGTFHSLPDVKRCSHETDHSPATSAESHNTWSCTSPSFYVFMWRCFGKQGYMSTFTKCSNMSFELEKGAGARLTAHTVTFCCDIQERNACVSSGLIHTACFLPKLSAERMCMAVEYTAKRGTD